MRKGGKTQSASGSRTPMKGRLRGGGGTVVQGLETNRDATVQHTDDVAAEKSSSSSSTAVGGAARKGGKAVSLAGSRTPIKDRLRDPSKPLNRRGQSLAGSRFLDPTPPRTSRKTKAATSKISDDYNLPPSNLANIFDAAAAMAATDAESTTLATSASSSTTSTGSESSATAAAAAVDPASTTVSPALSSSGDSNVDPTNSANISGDEIDGAAPAESEGATTTTTSSSSASTKTEPTTMTSSTSTTTTEAASATGAANIDAGGTIPDDEVARANNNNNDDEDSEELPTTPPPSAQPSLLASAFKAVRSVANAFTDAMLGADIDGEAKDSDDEKSNSSSITDEFHTPPASPKHESDAAAGTAPTAAAAASATALTSSDVTAAVATPATTPRATSSAPVSQRKANRTDARQNRKDSRPKNPEAITAQSEIKIVTPMEKWNGFIEANAQDWNNIREAFRNRTVNDLTQFQVSIVADPRFSTANSHVIRTIINEKWGALLAEEAKRNEPYLNKAENLFCQFIIAIYTKQRLSYYPNDLNDLLTSLKKIELFKDLNREGLFKLVEEFAADDRISVLKNNSFRLIFDGIEIYKRQDLHTALITFITTKDERKAAKAAEAAEKPRLIAERDAAVAEASRERDLLTEALKHTAEEQELRTKAETKATAAEARVAMLEAELAKEKEAKSAAEKKVTDAEGAQAAAMAAKVLADSAKTTAEADTAHAKAEATRLQELLKKANETAAKKSTSWPDVALTCVAVCAFAAVAGAVYCRVNNIPLSVVKDMISTSASNAYQSIPSVSKAYEACGKATSALLEAGYNCFESVIVR